MFGLELGLFGIILLFLDVWALIHTLSSRASPVGKAIWVVLILVLPFLGFLIWLIFGPRKPR